MNFEIPRLRVKLARTLQKYADFIKKPAFFLRDFLSELENINPSLAIKATTLLSASSKEDLDSFLDDLKLYLAANGAELLDPNDELRLAQPVSVLPGLGPKLSEALKDFGVATVKDVLYGIPMRYELLTEEGEGGKAVLHGRFEDSKVIRTRQGKQMLQAVFATKAGYVSGIWLHFNKQYPSSILKKGETYNLYGSVSRYNGMASIFHPELLDEAELGTVRPIYSLPGKVGHKVYQKVASHALGEYLPYVGEILPEKLRFKYRYPEIHDSLNTLHYPNTVVNVREIMARRHAAFARLVYEELFYLQLRLMLKKRSYMELSGKRYDSSRRLLDEITPLMPFRLTDDQRHALREILADMSSDRQMNRLLQGDVGSGKTIVAFIACLVAVKNGVQAAILAPTEVLAEQHFRNLEKFLANSGYRASILTGSMKAREKQELKEAVAAGHVDIIAGTHALLQENVEFKELGFVVIDEQHRFGVKQRKAIMDKGFTPDILLMTATPIPRTLALTYYGDLDLSEIRNMPPGRMPSITKAFRGERVNAAFDYVKEQLKAGDKAYIVYPAIESETGKLKTVTKGADIVKKHFPSKSVGLLHGKMKAEEKRQMLADFERGTLDILVSTTVVEVGVDVRDATVIMIENADRFGLSQLHQLRGRVGRNDRQSYCVLVASEEISEAGYSRLKAMEENNSGFRLAEIDLELRGQGDFFGVKQSGLPEFQFADIIRDQEILKAARQDATEIIEDDPKLDMPKNRLLRNVLMQRWRDEYDLFFVG